MIPKYVLRLFESNFSTVTNEVQYSGDMYRCLSSCLHILKIGYGGPPTYIAILKFICNLE